MLDDDDDNPAAAGITTQCVRARTPWRHCRRVPIKYTSAVKFCIFESLI